MSPSPGPPRPAHRPPSQAFWAPLYPQLPLLHLLPACLRPLFWRQLQPVSAEAGGLKVDRTAFWDIEGVQDTGTGWGSTSLLSRALRWPLPGMSKKPNYQKGQTACSPVVLLSAPHEHLFPGKDLPVVLRRPSCKGESSAQVPPTVPEPTGPQDPPWGILSSNSCLLPWLWALLEEFEASGVGKGLWGMGCFLGQKVPRAAVVLCSVPQEDTKLPGLLGWSGAGGGWSSPN